MSHVDDPAAIYPLTQQPRGPQCRVGVAHRTRSMGADCGEGFATEGYAQRTCLLRLHLSKEHIETGAPDCPGTPGPAPSRTGRRLIAAQRGPDGRGIPLRVENAHRHMKP